jgi:hypothetical protein
VTTGLPRLFTLSAAKAELKRLGANVSTDTLRREAGRGRLRLTRIGRKLFIREDHLEEYLSCQDQNDQARSAATGSADDLIPPSGARPGSIQPLDRRDAHRLAQLTFGKPS